MSSPFERSSSQSILGLTVFECSGLIVSFAANDWTSLSLKVILRAFMIFSESNSCKMYAALLSSYPMNLAVTDLVGFLGQCTYTTDAVHVLCQLL